MNKIIKKVASVLVLVAIIALAIVFKYFNPQPTPADCYDFEAVLAADFEFAKNTVTNGEDLIFFEAETVLNGAPTNEVVKVVDIMTVFQMGDRCLMVRHEEGAYDKDPEIFIADPGHWLGDIAIPMEPFPIKFQDAVKLLQDWKGPVPTGDKMVLRCPLSVHQDGKLWETAQYIFGTYGTGFVAVDTQTGDIENLEEGDKAQQMLTTKLDAPKAE